MEWLYPRGDSETSADFAAKLAESSSVFGILIICFLGTTTMYVFSTLLTANGNMKQLNLVAFSGIVINFSINLILIPRMNAYGAAYASLATQILTASTHVMLVWYYFGFKVNYRFISALGIFIGLVILFNWLSLKLPFKWQFNFLAMMLAGIVSAFALKLINISELFKLLKEKGT